MTPKENEESLVLALICAYERIGSSFFFLEVALEISPAVEALRGTIDPSPFAPAPFASSNVTVNALPPLSLRVTGLLTCTEQMVVSFYGNEVLGYSF